MLGINGGKERWKSEREESGESQNGEEQHMKTLLRNGTKVEELRPVKERWKGGREGKVEWPIKGNIG